MAKTAPAVAQCEREAQFEDAPDGRRYPLFYVLDGQHRLMTLNSLMAAETWVGLSPEGARAAAAEAEDPHTSRPWARTLLVAAPKPHGAILLQAAAAGARLSVRMLFSSFASLLGVAGHASGHSIRGR